jgi:hypothetical protein
VRAGTNRACLGSIDSATPTSGARIGDVSESVRTCIATRPCRVQASANARTAAGSSSTT